MRISDGSSDVCSSDLQNHGIKVRGYMSQLGPIPIPFQSWDEVPNNPFYAPNAQIVPELEAYMDQLRRDGDSIGARLEVVAERSEERRVGQECVSTWRSRG